jgi:choline dehydrogenase-like flavoprotein
MPHLRFGGSVFTLATLGLALAEDWPTRGEWLCDYGHYAMFYAMILPDGIGRIRALPNTNEPLITYRLTERDWRRLVQGAIKLAEALLAAGAEHIVPSIRGHGGWTRRSELRDNSPDFLLRELTSLMSIHLFASCPMGSDSDYYCTDSTGGLYGLENLSIADGSILPSAPGVNPQATIMALALRNADAFLAKPR